MSDRSDDLAGLTALIIAGGLGTRLRAVLGDQPKALVEVDGRPFISFLLDQLAEAGLRHTVLCTGFGGQQVRERLGDQYGPLRLAYSQESDTLGTAGALRLALPQVASDHVLVMNGDSFCEAGLDELWQWHRARLARGSLLLTYMPDTSRYGRVEVGHDGAVEGFQEKSGLGGPGWISAGIYLLSRAMLESIPAGQCVSIEREVFPAWVGRGLYGCQAGGRFLDFGTPQSFEQLPAFLAQIAPARREPDQP